MPKYNIDVELVGQDGNVFNLIALVRRALQKNNIPVAEIQEFVKKVKSTSSYNEALMVIMNTVNVTAPGDDFEDDYGDDDWDNWDDSEDDE